MNKSNKMDNGDKIGSFFFKGKPFCVELEFVGEVNSDTESLLIKSFYKGVEILPGLKVSKLYASSLEETSIQSLQMNKEFNQIHSEVCNALNKYNEFFRKWNNPES